MQCRTCGTPLPTGAAQCPGCGAATPYNQYGNPPTPATNYGAPPPPPPPTANPPYPYGNAPAYPSSQPGITPGGYPSQPGGYQYNPMIPNSGFPPLPPKPQKNHTLAIILSSVAAVVVLAVVIGVFVAVNNSSKPGNQLTPVAHTTPTQAPITPTATTEQHQGPAASSIILNAQSASKIDEDKATPITLADTFHVDETVYITYDLDLTKLDPAEDGIYGYTQVRYYSGDTYKSAKLTIDDKYAHAYFYYAYPKAINNTRAEIFWCYKSNCSDAELAQTVTFTVTE